MDPVPAIKGVKLSQLLEKLSQRKNIQFEEGKGLLEKEINVDFSGGEKKILRRLKKRL